MQRSDHILSHSHSGSDVSGLLHASSGSLTPYCSDNDGSNDRIVPGKPIPSAASAPAAQHHHNHPGTLNFDQLSEAQYHALLNLSDHTTTFLPGQACGTWHLPKQLNVQTIDPENMDDFDIETIFDLHVCTPARNDGGFLPGKQYIFACLDADSPTLCGIASIISLTSPILIKPVTPSDDQDESKKIIFDLLTQCSDVDIFFVDDIYKLRIVDAQNKQSILFIKLTENIVRYHEKKSHANRVRSYAIATTALGEGIQGTVCRVDHTLICHKDTISIHPKTGIKKRVVKFSKDCPLTINRNTIRDAIEHEHLMMASIPALFHTKQPVKNNYAEMNALISRQYDGCDLHDLLFTKTDITLTPAQRIMLCIKLAEKTQILHEHGIIHRDLKPENIIITYNPANNDIIEANIIDLGFSISAKEAAIGGGSIPGTQSYAAPEAWAGYNLDRPCDIFALGRIFWNILSGKPMCDFMVTLAQTQAARLPAFNALFGSCRANESHPAYMHSLYYLLMRMNEKNPAARITISEIISNLSMIQRQLRKPIKSTPPTHTSAAAAAVVSTNSGVRLFDTSQQPPQTSTGSDASCTATPAIGNGK